MKKKKIRITAVIMILLMILGLSTTGSLGRDLPSEDEKGSITVHKYSTASPSQTPGTGLELSTGDAAKLGTPLQNVGFSLYKVNSDYPINSTTTVADAKNNSEFISEQFTSKNGIVKWETLDIGYYVLVESTPPENGFQKAPDSIITLPMGITSTGSGWNYNIHVYPKNVKTSDLTKEILNKKEYYSFEDTATWKIDSKILDALKSSTYYGEYKVSDPLDSRLTYVSNSDIILATGGTTSPITLARGSDYTVDFTANNTVEWELTRDGIDKIDQVGAQALSIQFETTINASAIDTAHNISPIIANGARMDWENLSSEKDNISIDNDDKPTIELGGIVVSKVDSIETQKLLNGAEFKVAKTKADAEAGNYIKGGPTDKEIVIVTGDNPYNGITEEGWARISALSASISNDTKYYFVETKAPTGYVLRQNILEVTIPAGQKYATVIIKNQKIGDPPLPEEKPIFILPQTGGIGTTLFVLTGILLIMTALTLIAVRRRCRKEEV